ncbi:MAG: hypothetical protein ACHP85_27870, partial [Burkholderiales bacterium]
MPPRLCTSENVCQRAEAFAPLARRLARAKCEALAGRIEARDRVVEERRPPVVPCQEPLQEAA